MYSSSSVLRRDSAPSDGQLSGSVRVKPRVQQPPARRVSSLGDASVDAEPRGEKDGKVLQPDYLLNSPPRPQIEGEKKETRCFFSMWERQRTS